MAARGKFKDKSWRRSNGDPATIDDITVIVIPILPYKHEVCNPDEDAAHPVPDSPEEEVELEVHYEDKMAAEQTETGLEADSENLEIVTQEEDGGGMATHEISE